MATSLAGKRALVTGGSRGLGRAFCSALAAAGARVAFTYAKDANAAADTLAALPEGSRAQQVSVLDSTGTRTLVRELETAWGGVDILINNAGINQNLPIALLQEVDWDLVMDTNVKGAFLTTRAVLPGMIKRKCGVILNIGSLAGERVIEAPVHYSASKAALRGMTQALAKEVARHNVRALCLAPGLLDDGVGRSLPEHLLADYLKHNALGRVGGVAEVAQLAVFLVSDANSFMNGETILMDGGL